MLVFGTLMPPAGSGSKSCLMADRPVTASAPIDVPWYAYSRLSTLYLVGSPMRLKYALASFQADSTASEPEVVKNTLFRSPGASSASRAASSTAAGCA